MDGSELLQAILDSPTRHGIIVTDAEGMIRIWNKGAARIFQYTDEEIVGKSAHMLFSQDDLAHGAPDKEMATATRDGCAGDFRWHVRKDGTLFWADGMIYPVRSRSGAHMGFVKILRDATEEKQSGDVASRLALEDCLTGLPNRAEFQNRFVDMAASAQRHDRPLILLLLDLDHFKEVNDQLGHACGDALLQQAAHRMRAVLRDTDFIARFGGDEFVILQPDAESLQEGGVVADKLIEALSRPFRINARNLHIGASIGLAVYPQDADDLDHLFSKADLAMYRAKASGRGRYRYYSAQMDVSAHRRSLEHVQLRRAMKDRAFSLYYQPQIDATTGEVLAVEALLRCTDPFFANYPIERVLTIATETGHMRRLGLWMCAEAMRQMRRWQLKGRRDLILTLNFCRVELTDTRFAQRMSGLLAKYGLAPSQLEIDVPESQLTNDFDATQIAALHRSGVSIAIDDLGSGGMSLKHLFELPISTVKLDLGFLPDLPADPRSRLVASAIMQLATALGIRVVAERVESEHHAEFLHPWCAAMQGFHFAKPMDATDFTAWLEANDFRAAAAAPRRAIVPYDLERIAVARDRNDS
ncbi:MAG TPA: EAL domain-containing protein [Lysobacter sp.]